ncbi:MAG: choice-of-anchor D domain-containing protein [Spirochaetes bacterium]|nr:choice-of-anchor D domain-containing protein [Spirochaetota bacterium]
MNKQKIASLIIIVLALTGFQCEQNSLYDNSKRDDLLSVLSSDLESLFPAEVDINIRAGGIDFPSGGVYDFGYVIEGNPSPPVTFTIENLGGTDLILTGPPVAVMSGLNAADFSATDPAVTTLTPGASAPFDVTFTPGALGVRRAIMTIASNDPDEALYTINLTGNGEPVPVPDINVQVALVDYASGSMYDFGSVMLGNSGLAITFTIENLGTAPLSLTLPMSLGGLNPTDFILIGPASNSVAVGASETFTLTFTPGDTGAREALLTIVSDDPDEANYEINLMGTCTPVPVPEINVVRGVINYPSGSVYSFGGCLVGTSMAPVTFTIENLGSAPLNLSAAPTGSNNTEFPLTNPGLVIPVGSSEDFTVTFTPAATGSTSSLLTILSDDPDEGTYTIDLTGSGIEMDIDVQVSGVSYPSGTSTYSFGSVAVNIGSAGATFEVLNTGLYNLTLSGTPTVSGAGAAQFSVGAPGALLIPYGSSTTFSVTYTPTVEGVGTATLTILSDDPDESPYTIDLNGTGVVPDINVNLSGVNYPSGTSGYDFPEIAVGTSSPTVTFTIENLGGADLTLDGSPDMVQVGGANAGDFAVTQPGTNSLGSGASTTFTVEFSPLAVGSRTATITIPNTDPDSSEAPYTIDVAGIGLPTAGFPTASLVGMYLLDGDGTDAMSISGDLNLFNGSPLFNADHLEMTAYNDDVMGSLVGISNGDDVTIAINFYPTSTAFMESNFFTAGYGTRWISFNVSGTNAITVNLSNYTYANTFTEPAVLSQWNTLVCRINMATLTMTVWTNGVVEQWVFDPAFNSFTEATVSIQNHSSGAGFIGLIDNLFIYNRALSDAEVAAVLGAMR